MSTHSWQELSSLFQQAYELPAVERKIFLDGSCPHDGEMRAEVESLLRAHDLAEHFTDAGYTVSVGELSPQSARLTPGRRLGPYTVLRELGEGGMSTVFLAARADDAFDRLVAVKTLRSSGGGEGHERFLAERQVHANLEHPGIARLYGGGTSEQGVPFIVMEYIENGQPIGQFCDARQLGAAARVELFCSVCDAVAYAHRNLVVHRDLKPSNILVTPDGEAKLLDFGISKLLTEEARDWDPTRGTPGPLTPSYASPEQIFGEVITTSSDVFSLGLLLFRLLAGRPPHSSKLADRVRDLRDDLAAPTLEQVVGGEAAGDSPSAAAFLALDRGRRQDLEAIAGKAVRRQPAERYGSVEQLAADLRRWRQGLPVSARLPTVTYRLSRWLRRNWLVAAFAATVAVLLVGSSVILATQKLEVARERDRARDEAAKSERMLDLLLGLLEGSDPAKAQGSKISVRDVLLAAEPRIDQELASQPKVQAALFEAVGKVFLSLGSLEEAERILGRAHDLWQRTTWPESSTGATTLDLIAQVHIQRGAFEQALGFLERGRRLRRAELGPESAEEAAGLARAAYVHLLLYQADEAEALARRALGIFEQRGESGFEEEYVEALFNLGEALHRRDGRAGAEAHFRRALEESRRLLGPWHPTTLELLGKLAELESEAPANLELAEAYAREMITGLRHVYEGRDHQKVADSLDVLAGILARKSDLEEAETAFQESISMQRRLAGEESPFLAVTLGNLGWFHLFRRHDAETAEPILRQALHMAEKFFSPDATLLAYPLIGLGRCRTLLGEPDRGEPFLQRALAIRLAAGGERSLAVARAELFLGENLLAQGRCGPAATLLTRSRVALEAGGDSDDLERLAQPWRTFEATCRASTPDAASAAGP